MSCLGIRSERQVLARGQRVRHVRLGHAAGVPSGAARADPPGDTRGRRALLSGRRQERQLPLGRRPNQHRHALGILNDLATRIKLTPYNKNMTQIIILQNCKIFDY